MRVWAVHVAAPGAPGGIVGIFRSLEAAKRSMVEQGVVAADGWSLVFDDCWVAKSNIPNPHLGVIFAYNIRPFEVRD